MPVDVRHIFESSGADDLGQRCVDLLDAGELVVLPTETVYGAAGRLDRPSAVARLRSLRRDASGPFTIHLDSADTAIALFGEPSPLGVRMMRKLWPGPVALVFDVPGDVREQIASKLGLSEADLFSEGAVTLRCPDHPFTEEVLANAGGPIALAGVESRTGETPFDEGALALLEGKVALVVDAGRTRFSRPSTIVRVHSANGQDRYDVVREGVFDARIIARQLRTNILFVCSGNTCRSPMAAALATKLLRETYHLDAAGLENIGIGIASAGTYAMPGLRATPQAIDAVAALGGDLANHRSRPLSQELIHSADVIYTMARSHADAVRAMAPSAASRVVAIDPSGDVEDPIGGALSLYRDVAERFETLIAERFAETVFKLHPPAAEGRT